MSGSVRTSERAPARPAQAPSSFRPDVQGLRAIAVVLVVLYHARLPALTGGFVGVDVFFVISGFLITGHLCQSLVRRDFAFGTFYARRVRRILPASLCVLAASLLVAWLVVPPLALARVSRDAAWTALYIPNLLFAREGTDYLASPDPSLFQHYWSLGIEEQFYLLWPFIIWAVYRMSRNSLRVVTWTIALIVLASFAASILLTPINQPWAFFLLPTRAWELGVGALIALILMRRPLRVVRRVRVAIAGVALAALAACALLFSSTTPFPSYWAAVPVLATAAIIVAGPYDGLLGKLLQNRVALWIGAVSYSVYLVHWPLLILPQAAGSWMTPLSSWQSLLLGLLAFPLGWLSYRFVETPFRRPRAGWRGSSWPALAAAVIAGVLVAGIAVVGMRAVPAMAMHAAEAAPDFVLTNAPVAPPVVGSNLNVRLQDHQEESAVPSGRGCNLTTVSTDPPPGCTYGSDPDAPSVALIGDSHAAQWAPAFETVAEAGAIRLTAHTRSGCPLQDRSLSAGFDETPACMLWKQQVLDALAADPPDLIVLSSSVRPELTPPEAYERSMRALLPSLPSGSRIVLLQDTPLFPGDPMSCLSKHTRAPQRCAVDREDGVHTEIAAVDEVLADDLGVARLDFTEYLCGSTCPPVQGNLLVFKDRHHISKTFSREMAPVVAEALAPLLPQQRR